MVNIFIKHKILVFYEIISQPLAGLRNSLNAGLKCIVGDVHWINLDLNKSIGKEQFVIKFGTSQFSTYFTYP